MKSFVRRFYRTIRRGLGSSNPAPQRYANLHSHFEHARMIVLFYYIASVYFSADILVGIGETVKTTQDWDFLWPLYWVDPEYASIQLRIVGTLCFVSSLLAAVFHRVLAIRILFCAFFLLASTVTNSWAGINHPYHAWFWISFVLIFLPGESHERQKYPSRAHMRSYTTTFVMAQVMLFLFYSMSGFWKIAIGIRAVIKGEDGAFSFQGLAYNLADRIVQTDTNPLLANFFIENYVLTWFGYLAIMYIQFTAIAVAVRPRLHWLWGMLIILFHLGTWLLMEIFFIHHVLLLLMFFVFSPFRPGKIELRKTLEDLPILGRLIPLFTKGFPSRSSGPNVTG